MARKVEITPIEPGFYYHFWRRLAKDGPANLYAYEVLATGFDRATNSHIVIYRPVYGDRRKGESRNIVAPMHQFIKRVRLPMVDGRKYHVLQFTRIRNPRIVKEIIPIRDRMYPEAA